MLRWAPLVLLVACTATVDVDPPVAALGDDLLVEVGEAVDLSSASSVGVAFTFTFGDGTALEVDAAEATHTWDEPGHYTVFLRAENADGERAQDQMAVTVVWPLAEQRPSNASPLAATDSHWLAALPDDGALAVIDRSSNDVAFVDVCDHPRTVAAHGADAYVACQGDDTLRRVDLSASPPVVVATRQLAWGARPYGLAIDAAETLWVTLQGRGEVLHMPLDLEVGEQLVDRLEAGPDLRGLATWDGGALVSTWRSPDDAGHWALIDTDNTVAPQTLQYSPGPDSDTDARGLPNLLQQIVVRPDGRAALLPGLKSNVQRGVYLEERELTPETTVRADLRQITLSAADASLGAEQTAYTFDNRDHAIAAAFSPRGDWIYVAHHGAQVIDILDTFTGNLVGGLRDVGEGPDGLWVSEDGNTLAVLATLSQELVLYDVSEPSVQSELARIDLAPPSPGLSAEVRLGKQLFYAAVDKRMTSEQYVSCGSCHPEGSNDGRTWDFTQRGEGLRNTHSLLGNAGAAPLHWSGNFDEVQDFEHDIRGPQEGEGFLSDADFEATSPSLGDPKAGLSADLDALAAYVESLDERPRSPHRNPDGSMTDDAVAGEAIFGSSETGCTDCHVPPTYTDSAWLSPGVPNLHDVGTLTDGSGQRLGDGPLVGVDTPTLLGVHDTAPYLHDGSADTVMSVLTEHNPTDQHGKTSHLDADGLRQLEAFLQQL